MKIFLIGFMGTGKTYWGRIWAARSGLNFFDLDEMIEKEEGSTIVTLFEEQGEVYFRQKESALLKSFARRDGFLLSCGGGAPCFTNNMQWMNEQGITVYLEAPVQYILKKLAGEKEKRPLISSISPDELSVFIEHKLKEREPVYQLARFTIAANQADSNSLQHLDLHSPTPNYHA